MAASTPGTIPFRDKNGHRPLTPGFTPLEAAPPERPARWRARRSASLAFLLALGACDANVYIVPSEEPIRISVDVVVRAPEPTGDLAVTRAPSDPEARDRLVVQALRHARLEAAGDLAILMRLQQGQNGRTVIDTTHEVLSDGEPALKSHLQNLPWNDAEFEEATLAAGDCFFRYVTDLDDRARMAELRGQAVTALGACPVLYPDGRLYGAVSLNWSRDQTVDQDTAHRALSEAIDVLGMLLEATATG